MFVGGFSAYSRTLDWQRFREVADSVGAYLVVDMANVAGLIAVGLYPSPVAIADVTTFTTHKTRSEEHTSELQSRTYLVCRLLLEKKNNCRSSASSPVLPPHESITSC